MVGLDEDDVNIKELLTATVKLGAPMALLIFIVIWLTGDFNVRLRAIETQHQEMLQHAARTEDLTGRTYMAIERVFNVQLAQCLNAARNQTATQRCLADDPKRMP